MDEQQEMLCELWPEEQVELKPHSRLYHLEPIGVGSPIIESLTSYLIRLADAHSVSPRVLLTKEILPVWRLPSLYQDNHFIYKHLTAFWRESSFLISTSVTASGLLFALEQLTLRRDLYSLTMLPFKETFSHRNLIRRSRSWCPMCYEQWREANQIIYEPLHWNLQVILICPWHRCRLQLRCPNCANTQPPLTAHSQSGYCSRCDQWLGGYLPYDAESTAIPEEEWIWHKLVGNAVGQLLAAAANFPTPLHRGITAKVITSYLNEEVKVRGSKTSLARQLHVTRQAVSGWQSGKQIPQLGTLIQICAYLGISPLGFLTDNLSKDDSIKLIERLQVPPSKKSPRGHRWMNMKEIQSTLEAVLRDNENPPPCMREVARRLGYGSAHLWKNFPDLCRAISERYLEYQTKKSQERLERIYDKMRNVIQMILIQASYASYWRIEKSLGRGIFRDPRIVAIRQQILQELEWKQGEDPK